MFRNDRGGTNDIRHIMPTEEELRALPSAFYNCEICGFRVKTQSNLRAHQIKTHGLINDPKDLAFLLRKKAEIKDVFHCPRINCKYAGNTGKGFSKYWHLKQHYQTVHMKKAFQCTKCLQRFPTPSSHGYHKKTCGMQYKCPVCGRKYRAKKFLYQHARRKSHDITFSAFTLEKETPSDVGSIPIISNDDHGGVKRITPQITKMAILPVIVLPAGESVGRITASDIATAISRLSGNLIILPTAIHNAVPGCEKPQIGYLSSDQSTAAAANVAFENIFLPVSQAPPPISAFHPLSVTVPEHASGGYLVASSLQQTSPEGSSFVPLVDVGTATLRLSNAFTQTDVDIDHHQNQHHPCFPPPQLSPPKADLTNMYRPRGHQQNHRRRECCIGTPPANSGLMSAVSIVVPHMSHSSTYMSPGHSIELQYPEMNSNSTMTSYLPETVATAVVGMQPPPQKTTQGCFTQQTCPVLAPQRQDFHQTTLPQQQMYHPVAPTASDVVGHPSCYEFLDDQVPTTSSAELQYGAWRPANRLSVCAKSVQMGPANSVAVETTFDLAEFDPSSSGNCCWPTADSFTNIHTQTVWDPAEFSDWLNNRQTQTFDPLHHLTAAAGTDNRNWGSNSDAPAGVVCVGVNTDLLTPEIRSPYAHQ